MVHALFVPILGLEHEPQLAARLLELARAAQLKRYEQTETANDVPDEQPVGTGTALVRTTRFATSA